MSTTDRRDNPVADLDAARTRLAAADLLAAAHHLALARDALARALARVDALTVPVSLEEAAAKGLQGL